MKLNEVGNYLFVEIESSDWKFGQARDIIAKVKSTPGRIYYFDTKVWRIHKMYKSVLNGYLPLFSKEEEIQGEIEFQEFIALFSDDTSYNL
jgi:hypothetical protein